MIKKNNKKSAIEVKALKKSYGHHLVLKEISFQIEQNEIFALLGINGAGKTTILECIEGLKKYDSGMINIHGTLGIQLQSSSLPAHIKPLEALKLFSKWNHVLVDDSIIQSLKMNEIKNKQYEHLSTGQKRRLHLALALVNHPDILILDEPTAGLDVEGRRALHNQIRELKAQGKTIILASHDMVEVETLCDRIAIINNGAIVFCGTSSQLKEKIGRKYRIHIKTDQENKVIEATNIEDTLLPLLKDLKEKQIKVNDIIIDRGTLEEHFIEMARSNE